MVRNRLTVLYDSVGELNENVDQNSTHLLLKGSEKGVTVQERWIIPRTGGHDDQSSSRITWRGNNPLSDCSQSVIEPILNHGLNVYNDVDASAKGIFVKTPVYKVLHLDKMESQITDYLPSDVDLTFMEWKWESCTYDIKTTNDTIEIVEYSKLYENKTLAITKNDLYDKMEAGIFYIDSVDEEDINLSGLRCLWKDDADNELDKCIKTTLFYKPAYFHDIHLEGKVNVTLEVPTGLHPKVLIDLTELSSAENCEYFMFSQLPTQLFVDMFQSDPVLLFGETGLELPDYKVKDSTWGSEVLFNLVPGETNEITLHSRYLQPSENTSYGIIPLSLRIFKGCDTDSEDVMENPFYTKNFGLESYFTSNTVLHTLSEENLVVPIPKATMENYNKIQYTTAICLLLSLLYLSFKLFLKTTKHT
ncbi:hypothetical protein KAFR_0D00230 [Kazachstania africana CBS 2517]|uniref:Protein PBN1 n=1 Tax=Kazachstania africana (strain ATCC 22294 / BCRC 22015 / CBS 2517 / CECT 1963 / NBRC 1671 / NRRL Y-8276) TaxID=1071382 RepID=H2ATG9_KAZAF|nr:hypothetical protein KAFR_0D00230 [Kazachstania africana CBS 2517]CCF57669.1 hypothetical protein KAFR_0D00230 [Kazachstania africana CBS 2517]